jgi:galactokinase
LPEAPEHPGPGATPQDPPLANNLALAETVVAQSFSTAFGSSPSGVWSAPGRVNLMGEHTDYNAGLCLPIALPHRTFAAVRPRADRRLRLRSMQSPRQYDLGLDDVRAGNPSGWGAYAAGVLWALQEAGHDVCGLDLMVDGQVPQGAGLSSSAALECAVAAAASDLFGLNLLSQDRNRATLAGVCVKAENTIALAPTGGMDQSASLRCLAGQALLLDCRDFSVAQVPFDLSAHGLVLLVMDTRAEHALVDGQYAQRRRSCEQAARQLGVASLREVAFNDLDEALDRLADPTTRARARHIVTEIERVSDTVSLLRAGRLSEVGSLFNDSHASMRDDFEISCAELDVAVQAATAHGALGARMTGGGFGGAAIALVPFGSTAEVTAAVTHAFADNGFGVPHCFAITAGGSARRET